MTWLDMTWHDMIWYDIARHDMTWHDMNAWMHECMKERLTDWMSDWTTAWMNEWMNGMNGRSSNEWMNDWLIDWMNELTSLENVEWIEMIHLTLMSRWNMPALCMCAKEKSIWNVIFRTWFSLSPTFRPKRCGKGRRSMNDETLCSNNAQKWMQFSYLW